jgi:toxin ParE1/3/4
MLPVIFTPAAQAEIFEARDWYSSRAPEMAASLAAEIEAVVETDSCGAAAIPGSFQRYAPRRCRRFSYAWFFRVVDGTVYVIACFHSSRDPRQWQRRT